MTLTKKLAFLFFSVAFISLSPTLAMDEQEVEEAGKCSSLVKILTGVKSLLSWATPPFSSAQHNDSILVQPLIPKKAFFQVCTEFIEESINKTPTMTAANLRKIFQSLPTTSVEVESEIPNNIQKLRKAFQDSELTLHELQDFWSNPKEEALDGSFKLQGKIVGISDLMKHREKYKDLTNPHLWINNSTDINKGYYLLLDEDFEKIGANIHFYADYWFVVGEKKVTIKGLDGKDHSLTKAADGEKDGKKGADGLPGFAGGNSGNFYGEGKKFYNLKSLTIDVSGGRGGSGQAGGNGANGANGSEGNEKDIEERNPKCLVCSVPIEINNTICDKIANFARTTYTLGNGKFKELYVSGKLGQPGGDGGKGGEGGTAGKKGIIEIAGTNSRWKSIENEAKGANGASGSPGDGGKNGKILSRTYINEYILPTARGKTKDESWYSTFEELGLLIASPIAYGGGASLAGAAIVGAGLGTAAIIAPIPIFLAGGIKVVGSLFYTACGSGWENNLSEHLPVCQYAPKGQHPNESSVKFEKRDIKGYPYFQPNNSKFLYYGPDLFSYLCFTSNVYSATLAQVKKEFCELVRGYVDEDFTKILLANVEEIEELHPDQHITVTGSPLTTDEVKDLNFYMELCNAVYTDSSTREFIAQNHLYEINNKLDCTIKNKKVIEELSKTIESIHKKYINLSDIPAMYISKGVIQSKQVPSIEQDLIKTRLTEDYNNCIEKINNFLKMTNKNLIHDRDIKKIDNTKEELIKIKQEICGEFLWYFDAEGDTKTSFQAFRENLPYFGSFPISKFEGHYQRSPKAVVSFSFLSKTQLLNNKNISIIDVGFRNKEQIESRWNNYFVNPLVLNKHNKYAWFEELGEVDYIAYIERDATKTEKDKLVLVYSGSNSQRDWSLDLTIGYKDFLDLYVHKGIAWLMETSKNTSHSVLRDRVEDYYKSRPKPKSFEIITAGHSLGGALAELSAYYYKTEQLSRFKDILKLDNDKISVKTFSFGAPAIFEKNSKASFEKKLGKENIYRVWVDGDPIVEWTDGEKSELAKVVQGSEHVGRNIPLYNVEKTEYSKSDLSGYRIGVDFHGGDRYIRHLTQLKEENATPQHEKLIPILNDYITKKLSYKTRLKTLLPIIDSHLKGDSFELPEGIAKYIMDYCPTKV